MQSGNLVAKISSSLIACAVTLPAAAQGQWDLFVVNLSPNDLYWNQVSGGAGTLNDPLVTPQPAGIGLIDTNTPLGGQAWAFGGAERGDGIIDRDPPFPSKTIELYGQPVYYLSAVLDTATSPNADTSYPSFGVIILTVTEIVDGFPFANVAPAWIPSPFDGYGVGVGTEWGINFPLSWTNLSVPDWGEEGNELGNQNMGIYGIGAVLPPAFDFDGDPTNDGYVVEITTDLMWTWDAYVQDPCPPGGAPHFVETYEVTGDADNTPWSWRIRSTDGSFAAIEDLNVPGVPVGGSAFDVAEAFADSINAARDAQGCNAGQINAEADSVFGTVILSVTTGDSTPFELLVGPAPGDPNCLVGTGLPACNFNPLIEELPLPGFDCNMNGFDDFVDIVSGASTDADGNGIPDECECPIDLNGDGAINTQDLLVFLNHWTSGNPISDWNNDGNLNTQDVLAYLNDWVAGC